MSETSPKIKICGITNLADAELAVELGAWAIGMIFFQDSPRRCSLQEAQRITAALARKVELCGVFVNDPLELVVKTSEDLGLTIVQLHGDEGPVFCSEAARRTGCRVIKAARVHSGADIQALSAFHTNFHLLDSYVRGARGGTGETFAWDLAQAHGREVPLILSGGLNPDNVADAIAAVRPYAVDVASGVADSARPPRKDPEKLLAFAAAVVASASVATP